MVRDFGFLRSRLLLMRELELAYLEEKILKLDDQVHAAEETGLMSWHLEAQQEKPGELAALLDTVATKLKDYGNTRFSSVLRFALLMRTHPDDLVQRSKSYLALRPPPKKRLADVKIWLDNERPMLQDECEDLLYADDYVSLKEGDGDEYLDTLLGSILNRLPQNNPFVGKAQKQKVDDGYLTIRSGTRINFLIRLLLTLITAATIIAPAAILPAVKERRWQLLIILGFTMAFSAVLNMTTRATRLQQLTAYSGRSRFGLLDFIVCLS
ncbi:uncharacterized protein KY384_000865 [Bacidia gigantensis]|uniref:uncharacterized protein n=1 Tax=Bacidia gigantensis TaxID=2732470 RepID=UPI001D03D7DE|nr:uncharacterized protein KY384_000865 [Bacidia gigantensis]KAG8534023.1 hypothetical protein KY384_000865 [Bacidia gigantensis]